jgi:capsular exopolysaccharide synthesis family protein
LLSDTKQEALNLNEKIMQYEVLRRDLETNKQLYDTIMKKIKEQDITKQIQTVNVWVVEKAETPQSPVKPRKTFNIFFGIMVGLLGGTGLAFFIDYLDNTIKSPEELEKKLEIPVLGMISLFKEKENIEEIVKDKPSSAFAEEYKTLRTSILLSSARKPQNILITSIGPEEGKTVTSSNLALSISQSEHSVLLIDGDLRKPRIHKVFGIDNSKGLSSFLAGISKKIIHRGPSENLMIIPSGPVPPNPSELLGSSRMNDLISIINKKFDIILWDSAPLMTVSDSLILSKVLDGTILVTWAGKTTYEGVRRGLKLMHDIKSRTLGIIINAFDVRKSDYYYYRYSKYYSSDESSRL